jgi:hypothetical protein
MRKSLVTAAAFALIAGGAMAQTPPAATGPQNRPVNSSESPNRMSAAPVKGANSFTEGEARARMERLGFTGIKGLQKDNNGIWRGQAMKDGRTVSVSLDFQGNVTQADGQGSSTPANAAQQGAGR